MIVLLALLWCIYLSECLVWQRAGEWLFRAHPLSGWRARGEADVLMLGGRVGLSWAGLLPWMPVYLAKGADLDLDRTVLRLRAIEQATRWLRLATGALFVCLMLGVTFLVITDRLLSVLLPYVITTAAIWLATLAAFGRAFRRVHGTAPSLEMWIAVALSPVSVIRSVNTVCASALDTAHPVTAAAVFLTEPDFVRVARQWHFDAVDLRPRIERIAHSKGLLAELTAAPHTWDTGLARFCPRCHETYTAAAEHCADCAEVRLVPLPNQ